MIWKMLSAAGILTFVCQISAATDPNQAEQAQQLEQLKRLAPQNIAQNDDTPTESALFPEAKTKPAKAAAATEGAPAEGAAKPESATAVASAAPASTSPSPAADEVKDGPPSKEMEEAEMGKQPTANEVMRESAFKELSQDKMPMTTEQIIRFRKLYNETQQAIATDPGTPPKPVATSQLVSLAPGSTPPVIRLSQGFVSSLVFLDSTGAPWPIQAYDLGNPSAFNIQWDQKSSTLMVQAIKMYTYGNLAVRLKNLNTPVMLTLIPGQQAVDYRVDLRIPGIGPLAVALPTGTGLPGAADPLLLKILDGVAPDNSKLLSVSGGTAMAWATHDAIYVRTSMTILSPGWIASMRSADGMHAYKMQKTPLLLVSDHGRVMQLKIEGL